MKQELSETIRHLAARWSGARQLLPAFPLLAGGRPLAVSRLAEVTGVDAETLDGVLDAVRCERDEQGRLIDLFGMTLSPTPIRLRFDEVTIFACCALWAHVIPRLVGRVAEVRSTDPQTGESVLLTIDPERVLAVTPQESTATLAVASAGEVAADVSAAFCVNVRHFSSRQSAERFAQQASCRTVVEIAELHLASKELFSAIWAGFDR